MGKAKPSSAGRRWAENQVRNVRECETCGVWGRQHPDGLAFARDAWRARKGGVPSRATLWRYLRDHKVWKFPYGDSALRNHLGKCRV